MELVGVQTAMHGLDSWTFSENDEKMTLKKFDEIHFLNGKKAKKKSKKFVMKKQRLKRSFVVCNAYHILKHRGGTHVISIT